MAIPASVTLYVNWANGTLSAGTYTAATPDVPNGHTYSFTNSAGLTSPGGDWGSQEVCNFPNYNSTVSSTVSSATVPTSQGRVLFEVEGTDTAGDTCKFVATTQANGYLRFWNTGTQIKAAMAWQGGNDREITLGSTPSGAFRVEFIYDTNNGTASQRFRGRMWDKSGSPGSFIDAGAGTSAGSTDEFTTFRCPANGDAHPTYLGMIIVSDDITEDLSAVSEGGGVVVPAIVHHMKMQGFQ